MSQSNTSSNATKKSNSTFETKLSLGLATITLVLIFGYFFQSAVSIHQQEIIVIAIDRIEAQMGENNEQE